MLNNEKVYIEGYVVGFMADATGTREKQIQVSSGEIVSVDERFIHKSITPEKVKIPQMVADWYEENKDDFEGNLFRCAHNIPSIFDGAKLNEFEKWFLNASTKPFQILVNMHQFGYEVEKEKRYLVKIRATKHYFAKDGNRKIYFSLAYKSCFTKKELEEAGFGWVFSCEGVEVKKVEE